MQNPFISHRKNLFYYLILWTVITAVHVLYIDKNYSFGLYIALADGLFFNFSFAIFGLGLWYLIKYSVWDEKDNLQVLINLFAGGIIIIAFWIGFNELLLRLIFNSSEEYLDFLKSFRFWRISVAIFYYTLTILIYYVIFYYARLQEKKSAEIELKRNISEARLNLLRNQVNPHFLFNSLNSISSLTISEADKAREMIGKLSTFLRHSLIQEPNAMISLEEELNICKEYLEIEKIRFSDKFDFKFDIPSDLKSFEVPNMILQPLFENSIKYGVQENTGNTIVQCFAQKSEDSILISISNTMESSSIYKKESTGFGHRHIKERLFLKYEGKAHFSLRTTDDSYTAEIKLPLKF